MSREPPDSAACFAAWRNARAEESEKSTVTNMRSGSPNPRRPSLNVFVLIFFVVVEPLQREEESRQLPPLHDAEQRAKPIPTDPGPALPADEFRRRRCRF